MDYRRNAAIGVDLYVCGGHRRRTGIVRGVVLAMSNGVYAPKEAERIVNPR